MPSVQILYSFTPSYFVALNSSDYCSKIRILRFKLHNFSCISERTCIFILSYRDHRHLLKVFVISDYMTVRQVHVSLSLFTKQSIFVGNAYRSPLLVEVAKKERNGLWRCRIKLFLPFDVTTRRKAAPEAFLFSAKCT